MGIAPAVSPFAQEVAASGMVWTVPSPAVDRRLGPATAPKVEFTLKLEIGDSVSPWANAERANASVRQPSNSIALWYPLLPAAERLAMPAALSAATTPREAAWGQRLALDAVPAG